MTKRTDPEYLMSRISKLKEENELLKAQKKKLKNEIKELKGKMSILQANSTKTITPSGRVVKKKEGKWKAFTNDYPLLAKSYYECVTKYGWVVRNHYHLAGYLRKLVEGDPKEGIPPQMSADRLARRYAFLAAIPDNWWNGNVLFGPPPKTEEKGQARINDINNLMDKSVVKSFWKKFSKEWDEKNGIQKESS